MYGNVNVDTAGTKHEKFKDHTKNPYHKILTEHGFVHHKTENKPNAKEGIPYTAHTYTHPKHKGSRVEIAQYHDGARPSWHHTYKKSGKTVLRNEHRLGLGDRSYNLTSAKNQLHHHLSMHYGNYPGNDSATSVNVDEAGVPGWDSYKYNGPRDTVLKSNGKDAFGHKSPKVSRVMKGHTIHAKKHDDKHTKLFHVEREMDGKQVGKSHILTHKSAAKMLAKCSQTSDAASGEMAATNFYVYKSDKPTTLTSKSGKVTEHRMTGKARHDLSQKCEANVNDRASVNSDTAATHAYVDSLPIAVKSNRRTDEGHNITVKSVFNKGDKLTVFPARSGSHKHVLHHKGQGESEHHLLSNEKAESLLKLCRKHECTDAAGSESPQDWENYGKPHTYDHEKSVKVRTNVGGVHTTSTVHKGEKLIAKYGQRYTHNPNRPYHVTHHDMDGKTTVHHMTGKAWHDLGSRCRVMHKDKASVNTDTASGKKYYSLVEMLPHGRFKGIYTIQFGDFVRKVVQDELDDMKANGSHVKGTKYKIICTGPSQDEIQEAVKKLNGGKDFASLDKVDSATLECKVGEVEHYTYDHEKPTRIHSKDVFGRKRSSTLRKGDRLYASHSTYLAKGVRFTHHAAKNKEGGRAHVHVLTAESWKKLHGKLTKHTKA